MPTAASSSTDWEDVPDDESEWEVAPAEHAPERSMLDAVADVSPMNPLYPFVGPVSDVAKLATPEGRQRLRSRAQGMTFGFADEAESGLTGEPIETVRAQHEAARQSYPGEEVAGALAVPLPGPGKATGLAKVGRMAAQGAGVGFAAGLGYGQAGDIGERIVDALPTAAMGAGAGLLAGGADALITKARGAIGGVSTRAAREGIDANVRGLESENVAAVGRYRNMVQQASRDLEVLEREAQFGGPRAAEARGLLNSQKGAELRDMVVRGKLESAPGRVAEAEALKAEAQVLNERDIDEKAARMFRESVGDAPGRAVEVGKGALVRRMGQGALNMAANWIPGLPEGAKSAFKAGANALAGDPAGRFRAARGADALLKLAQKLGHVGAPLLEAAARGPTAVAVTDFILSERDPRWRQAKEQAANDGQ